MKQTVSEAYPEPIQTSKMTLFVKIGKSWKASTVFEKSSILDVPLCSEYTSDFSFKQSLRWRGTDISNTHEKSTKNQNVTEWCRCSKCGAMNKNVDGLCCHENEAVEYFELLDMGCSQSESLSQPVK